MLTTYTKHKCSKCGTVDRTETVTTMARGAIVKTLHCLNCAHEKTISTTTTTDIQDPPIYTLQQKKFEVF